MSQVKFQFVQENERTVAEQVREGHVGVWDSLEYTHTHTVHSRCFSLSVLGSLKAVCLPLCSYSCLPVWKWIPKSLRNVWWDYTNVVSPGWLHLWGNNHFKSYFRAVPLDATWPGNLYLMYSPYFFLVFPEQKFLESEIRLLLKKMNWDWECRHIMIRIS